MGSSVTLVVLCIISALIILVIIHLCLRRKRNLQGRVLSPGSGVGQSPVVITTTTTAGGYPASVEPTPGGGFQATPYPTAIPMPVANPPYPTHPGAQPMPHQTLYHAAPPVPGFQPHAAPPYPPEGASSLANQSPPSYDQVVGADLHGKQAPYNPNYMGN